MHLAKQTHDSSESVCEVLTADSLQEEEYYVCIHSHRYADTILFHHEGGVDIGDVDAKVKWQNTCVSAPHDAQNARRSRTRTPFHSLESCFVRGLHPLKLQPGGGFTL